MFQTNAFKIFAISSVIFISPLSAQAQSQCKGLESDACSVNATCGWVESYVRKDGREVSSFCRTSNKGKAKVSQAAEQLKKPA